jgi:uncharacterized protein involved in cysteine biosynthesis
MGGAVEDWIELIRSYAVDYIGWLLQVASSPSYAASQAAEFSSKPHSKARTRIPVFLFFCILIGATLGLMIPNRPPIKDRAQVAVTVALLWIFISSLVHVLCRLMQGTGSFIGTLVTMLQVLAVVYVMSYFLTLLLSSAMLASPAAKNLLYKYGFTSSGDLLLKIQFLMLLVYVPLSVGSVHGFRAVRRVAVGLIAATCAVFLGRLVFAMGGC